MTEPRPPRPTPGQLAVRRAAALLIVIAALTGLFVVARGMATSLAERFAEAAPTDSSSVSASPKQSKPPKHELKACRDADISIDASITDGPDFTVGDTPTVRAIISNVSSATCLRDVGSRANEVYVVNSDGYRVWSSNRCPVKQSARLVELAPGARYQITVIWPGTRNPKKCGELATAVAPGEFSVFVSNGNAVSEPALLTLA